MKTLMLKLDLQCCAFELLATLMSFLLPSENPKMPFSVCIEALYFTFTHRNVPSGRISSMVLTDSLEELSPFQIPFLNIIF